MNCQVYGIWSLPLSLPISSYFMSFVEAHNSRHVPRVHFQACKACSNHSSQATDHHHGAGNAKAQKPKEPWQGHWYLRPDKCWDDATPTLMNCHQGTMGWIQTTLAYVTLCYHCFSLRSCPMEHVIRLPALSLSVLLSCHFPSWFWETKITSRVRKFFRNFLLLSELQGYPGHNHKHHVPSCP